MKRSFLFIVILMLCCTFYAFANAASYDFLTIIIDDGYGNELKSIYYPEGSTFKVVDNKQKDITPKGAADGSFTLYGKMTLIVYPQYRKNKPDSFQLKKQRLRVYTTAKAAYAAGFGAGWNKYHVAKAKAKAEAKAESDPYGYASNGVTVQKELTQSLKNTDQYNLKLTFSNGIIFTYEDGVSKAVLNDKELKIQGKYVIPSELGTAKLSFNPGNGVVWWVFETPREK